MTIGRCARAGTHTVERIERRDAGKAEEGSRAGCVGVSVSVCDRGALVGRPGRINGEWIHKF